MCVLRASVRRIGWLRPFLGPSALLYILLLQHISHSLYLISMHLLCDNLKLALELINIKKKGRSLKVSRLHWSSMLFPVIDFVPGHRHRSRSSTSFPVTNALPGLPLLEDSSTPGQIRIFICFNFVAPLPLRIFFHCNECISNWK